VIAELGRKAEKAFAAAESMIVLKYWLWSKSSYVAFDFQEAVCSGLYAKMLRKFQHGYESGNGAANN